ncbi:MAG: SLBB domain-containing protein [Candidatus Manganitrophus sp. SA1]|nr:SLBB domain-containing protein [Candidatus Manganitrophus morganii]
MIFTIMAQIVLVFSISFAQEFPSFSQSSNLPPATPESFGIDQNKTAKDAPQRQLMQQRTSQPPLAEGLQEDQFEKPTNAEPTQATDKKLSAFEEYVQGKSPEEISTAITQFGYDLFQQSPNTFAPVDVVPIGPSFLLGPGDEIRITLWGKVNAEYPAIIDRDGKISLPQIGILHLAGLNFSEAKSFLETELSRYYRPSEVKMNVSMGRLRSIRVFVVGKAQRPGSYTLSSLSTLINALFAAGGINKTGTMRDIQVRRNGETLTHFDMYDFLLKGDKTKDIRLMPEDVIFIPTIGPLAGIAGDVRSPAVYELKEEMGLQSFIEMAGGLNEIAFKGRIQISRIIDNSQQITLESNLEEIKTKDIKVQPGDFVKVFSVVQDKKLVKLSGAVQTEGEYAASPGMTIKDLISMAGGLKDYAYLNEAELTRISPTPEGPKIEKMMIALDKALAGHSSENVVLKENDYLLVKTVPEWGMYKTVEIVGEVRFPGSYTIKKGERLSSLIERAGGFTDKAYLKGALFTRESVRKLQQAQLDESIERLQRQVLSKSATATQAALTPEDALQQKTVLEQRNALIERMKAAKAKGRIAIQLSYPDELKGTASDLLLEEGDNLMIPEKAQHIQVIGSVYNQTAFIYSPKMTVSEYLKNAGGMTDEAEERELYVLKVDGSAVSQKVERGFFSKGLLSSVLNPGDTIVVPEKIERVSWLKEVKDITQILFQIAATAGIIIKVF